MPTKHYFHDSAKNFRSTCTFFVDGVGGIPELNQADGIHPNAEAAKRRQIVRLAAAALTVSDG